MGQASGVNAGVHQCVQVGIRALAVGVGELGALDGHHVLRDGLAPPNAAARHDHPLEHPHVERHLRAPDHLVPAAHRHRHRHRAHQRLARPQAHRVAQLGRRAQHVQVGRRAAHLHHDVLVGEGQRLAQLGRRRLSQHGPGHPSRAPAHAGLRRASPRRARRVDVLLAQPGEQVAAVDPAVVAGRGGGAEVECGEARHQAGRLAGHLGHVAEGHVGAVHGHLLAQGDRQRRSRAGRRCRHRDCHHKLSA